MSSTSSSSDTAKAPEEARQTLVITVHGIQTFGAWQERLEMLLAGTGNGSSITVLNYKYGVFSIIAFCIPFLRWLVVRQFRKFLLNQELVQWDLVHLVGHSFGTHIIDWVLRGAPTESSYRPTGWKRPEK
jgi:hypothetical protein